MTDGKDGLPELEALSRQVADAIVENDSIRLISHNDADGLSAAGIMCNALYRKGIPFHATILGQFDRSAIDLINKTPSGAVILCDMGSGQVELVSMIQNAIIIDHHKPTGKVEHIHFNPHLAGIDGSSELCASCGAYMVARQMGENSDLAGLAIAGAIGDKQPMTGSNKSILDEAIRNEVVSSKKGLRMGDDPVEEYLEYSFEPFLDITGDKEKIRSFTESAGIRGSLKGFSEVQLVRFASLLALKLAQQGNPLAINSLIGDVFFLNKEVVSNAYDLVNILNACGSVEKADLGLAVCMRDASIVEEAKSTAREHQRIIVNNIRKALGNIRSAQNFRYVHLDDSGSTGAIAGTMTRYLYPDKPFITLNEVEDRIKVSARGTRKLVMTGLDLAAVMRESAESVGGIGGGHDVASGASIPKGTEPKFLEVADSMIGRQLAGRK